ncbi:hypothetical protein QTN25_009298 [Entamoeba marina]
MENIVIHKTTVKKFEKPKFTKSESVTTCNPADGEFAKTHIDYTPLNLGKRFVNTLFNVETRPLQRNMLFGEDGLININLLKIIL